MPLRIILLFDNPFDGGGKYVSEDIGKLIKKTKLTLRMFRKDNEYDNSMGESPFDRVKAVFIQKGVF